MVTRSRSSGSAVGGGAPTGYRRRTVLFAAALLAFACAHAAIASAQDRNLRASVGNEIAMRAFSLLGVPYRPGGDDPVRGLDCSGLVRHAIRAAAGLDLPRRSEQMSATGRPIANEDLAAGDLVFFNTLGRPFSHVAIYVGDGQFVHAPTRGGWVRIESMQLPYWRARFDGARRLGAAPATSADSVVRDVRPRRAADDPFDRHADEKP
jgi:cell wall-associated NlpC family hydrolase